MRQSDQCVWDLKSGLLANLDASFTIRFIFVLFLYFSLLSIIVPIITLDEATYTVDEGGIVTVNIVRGTDGVAGDQTVGRSHYKQIICASAFRVQDHMSFIFKTVLLFKHIFWSAEYF